MMSHIGLTNQKPEKLNDYSFDCPMSEPQYAYPRVTVNSGWLRTSRTTIKEHSTFSKTLDRELDAR